MYTMVQSIPIPPPCSIGLSLINFGWIWSGSTWFMKWMWAHIGHVGENNYY